MQLRSNEAMEMRNLMEAQERASRRQLVEMTQPELAAKLARIANGINSGLENVDKGADGLTEANTLLAELAEALSSGKIKIVA